MKNNSSFPENLQNALLTNQEMVLLDEFMSFAETLIDNEDSFLISFPWSNFVYNLKDELIRKKVGYYSFSDFFDNADVDNHIFVFDVTQEREQEYREKYKAGDFGEEDIGELEKTFNKNTKTIFTEVDNFMLSTHSHSISLLHSMTQMYLNLKGEDVFKLLIRYEKFWNEVYRTSSNK